MRKMDIGKNSVKSMSNSVEQISSQQKMSLYSLKEAEKRELVFSYNSEDFRRFKLGESPSKRPAGSKPPFDFIVGGKSKKEVKLSKNWETAEVRKVLSAHRILSYLDKRYMNIFKDQISGVEEDSAEKMLFLNSSLLHLIATTDGNEDTLGHSQLVAGYTSLLAKVLGIEDKEFLINIERGALLHDIGKIGIPESILRKAGPLTNTEIKIVREHVYIGYEIIEEFEFLKKAAQVVLYHHERYDGTGYHYGLKGEEIPLEARIFFVVDTLDAITSDRPYREGNTFEEAYREIEKSQGTQFDPHIVEAFLSVPQEKWQNIKEKTKIGLYFPTVH